MKKRLIIVLGILIVALSGCFETPSIIHEEKMILTLDSEYIAFTPYEEVPSFVFEFEGFLSTAKNVPKKNYTAFSNNEDIILSTAISNLLKKYHDNVYYETISKETVIVTYLTVNEQGILHNIEIEPDDKTIYNETAYIALDNGLKLTIDYRRFTYKELTYYVWRYTKAVTMWLYYPFMVIEEDNSKKLLIITLPNRITFQVGPQLQINSIMKSESYLYPNNMMRYTFNYLEDHETLEEKQKYVKDYYLKNFGGILENGDSIIYNYLGYKFKIVLTDNNFTMHCLGRA